MQKKVESLSRGSRLILNAAYIILMALSTVSCRTRYASTYGLRNDISANRTYESQTIYSSKQNLGSYESPPSDYQITYLQSLSRHGSSGLDSPTDVVSVQDFLKQAEKKKALSTLGLNLRSEIENLIKINSNLGKDLPGIKSPGYGNLSSRGRKEQRGLGERLFKRQREFWLQLGQRSSRTNAIDILTSGEKKAQDSARLFTTALVAGNADLKPLLRPAESAVSRTSESGVDRFLLYFHQLDATLDIPPADKPLYAKTLAASLAYQRFNAATGADSISAKVGSLSKSPEPIAAAKMVLERLVDKEFITDQDSAFALVSSFYRVYAHCPALSEELMGKTLQQYFPENEANTFAKIKDMEEFYKKGPSTIESHGVTSHMAQGLFASFFAETDSVVTGTNQRAALLRFANAETVIPLATALGLDLADSPIAATADYSYESSTWRGESVAPFAANLQWEVYQKAGGGNALVKLLYNEKEIDFKDSCAPAKVNGTKYYYDYAQLKKCYFPEGSAQ